VQVAAVWARDGRDWRLLHAATAEEVRREDAAWRPRGYFPLDVSSYPTAVGERYAALWGALSEEVADARLEVGVPGGSRQAAALALRAVPVAAILRDGCRSALPRGECLALATVTVPHVP